MSTKSSVSAYAIFDILGGCQKTQVLYTACSLGIFDELHKSNKPMTASQLATNLSLNPDATERLLNACTGISLLIKSKFTAGTNLYQNSPTSEKFLTKDSPSSLKPFVLMNNDVYALFGQLPDAVKTGKSQRESALGYGEEMFDAGSGTYMYVNQDKTMEFLGTMDCLLALDAEAIVRALDLSKYRTACDLGGGTGTFGVALAKAYPQLDVTVMDLKHVVDVMHHFLPADKPANFTAKSGDFCDGELPGADLYILCHVIHDWGDQSLTKLLGRVRSAINPGGALLVLENILNEEKNGPPLALADDLITLLHTEGRERTASEYRTLLENHGFTGGIQVKLIPEAHFTDAILALK